MTGALRGRLVLVLLALAMAWQSAAQPCTPAVAAQPTLPSGETVWLEDALPSGAQFQGGYGPTVSWSTAQAASGTHALSPGGTATGHWESYVNELSQPVLFGERVFGYLLVDECAVPRQIRITWDSTKGAESAYWGENLVGGAGVNMGPIPTPGEWVRFELPSVTLEQATVTRIRFIQYDGHVSYDHFGKIGTACVFPPASAPTLGSETIWVDDSLPAGASLQNGWGGPIHWETSQSASGTQSLVNYWYGNYTFESYITGMTERLEIGEKVVAYFLVNPCAIPTSIRIAWDTDKGTQHAAWGEQTPAGDVINMGPIPTPGEWVRVELPSIPTLEQANVWRIRLTHTGGQVFFDRFGKTGTACVAPPIPPPTLGTETVWVDDSLPAGASLQNGWGGPIHWDTSQGASGTKSLVNYWAGSTYTLESYITGMTERLEIGEKVVAYFMVNPCAIPSSIRIAWDTDKGTQHAAWGTQTPAGDVINMGPIPTPGEWIRVELPSIPTLEQANLWRIRITHTGGQVWFDRFGKTGTACVAPPVPPPTLGTETVWVDDSLPSGAELQNGWGGPIHWDTSQGASGTKSLVNYWAGSTYTLESYINNLNERLEIGEKVVAYFMVNPCAIPTTIRLAWDTNKGTQHAVWGEQTPAGDVINMGPIPTPGEWIRVELPSIPILEQANLWRIRITHTGGQVWFDRFGKTGAACVAAPVPPPTLGTETVWVDDSIPAGAQLQNGWGGPIHWETSQSASGSQSLVNYWAGSTYTLESYINNLSEVIGAGETTVAYFLINPCAIPTTIRLAWDTNKGTQHAVWGVHTPAGDVFDMGPIPAAGEWIRVQLPSSSTLEQSTVWRIRITHTGGQVWFDRFGKTGIPADQTAPVVTVTSPSDGSVTKHTAITVTGTATDDVGIQQVTVNGVTASRNGSNWTASITLPSTEGPHVITATATDTSTNTDTDDVTVTLDQTGPAIAFENSTGIVYPPEITVSGTVTDALSGVATVTCNGAPATVNGGIFSCTITMPMGPLDVVALATDVAGNTASVTRTYTRQSDTIDPVIIAVPSQPMIDDGWINQAVTIAFECGDAETSIVSCSSPVTFSTEGAEQVATGTAVDAADNSASVTFTVNVDLTAPTLTLDAPSIDPVTSESTIALSGTASDALSGITTVRCNDVSAPIDVDQFTCTISLFAGPNVVRIETVDEAGNETLVQTTVLVDTIEPTLTITAPDEDLITESATVTVTGTVSDDDEITSVTVNGVAATLSGGGFSAEIPLVEGDNAISVVALDRAGNDAMESTSAKRIVVPTVSVTDPLDLLVTGSVSVDVHGTVSDPNATVLVNEHTAIVSGNTFVATDVPLAQGRTVITATATSASGVSSTTSINVFRDAVPPRAQLYFPSDGATVSQSPITVTGMVDDIVVGTINAGQVSVWVNGTAATVLNRAFTAEGIVLDPGLNLLTIEAVDQGGNAISLLSRVTYDTNPASYRFNIVSGNGQSAAIGSQLSEPVVVRLTSSTGIPLAGREVQFSVVANNGTVSAASTSGRTVTVVTNAAGQASAVWTLGTRAGAGNQRLAVAAANVESTTEFVATGMSGQPALIVVDSGIDQFGSVGVELSRPLVAIVVDRGSNRLENVPVTFSVERGGGSFAGEPSITVMTDSDGRAIARPILGPDAGADNNLFAATTPGVTPIASFLASALIPGLPAETKISGVVLDNSNMPIEGVSIRIDGTPLTTQSDAEGLFSLTGVPVGYVKLFVDGSTAQRPGTWPMLEYAMYTVSGQDNTLGMPIYLLPIDVAHGIAVSEIQGGVLTLPEMPGFSLTVMPGSATFPGGGRIGTVSVTLVHSDKMPMPPGFGQQPRFIVTIQPPGVHFDPPAAMVLPNVDGLAPGEVTEMYSFDHDLGQFVAIGTGSVSEDGSVVRSDPGIGIIKGGWHCGGNPAASGTSANCGDCKKCVGTQCEGDPAKQGQSCTDDGDPTTEDRCNAGVCEHKKMGVTIGSGGSGGGGGGGPTGTENSYVDRDDPSKDWLDAVPLPSGRALYGSPGLLGDHVAWRAVLTGVTPSEVINYRWNATSDTTTITGPGGPTASSWTINGISWNPGVYTITLEVDVNTPSTAKAPGSGGIATQAATTLTASYVQEVGVRTDDYLVVGWINPALVTLNTTDVIWKVTELFPTDGLTDKSNLRKAAAFTYLVTLSLGGDARPMSDPNDLLNAAERRYILNWMFKFGANSEPPDYFATELGLEAFHLVKWNYKLFNRLQAKYLVRDGEITDVVTLKRDADIGWTIDPVWGLPVPGEAGPKNGVLITDSTGIHHMNDGTPDSAAVAAFHTLLNPLRWNNIGSRIHFTLSSGIAATITTQLYPTYFIYRNKFQNLADIRVQALEPSGNFNMSPYPPGPPYPPYIIP